MFIGWYTAPTGGVRITESTKVSGNPTQTLYAHWSAVTVDADKVTISATKDKTVVVKAKESHPVVPNPVYKTLEIGDINNATILRDYEQLREITVCNPTDQTLRFYLEAVNEDPETGAQRYPDLSYEIIKDGSKDSPMIIGAGEEVKVTLSIFAQNAERDTYIIPLAAYVQSDGEYVEDSKKAVTLSCELPVLDLSWTLVSSSNTSLSRTYRITNNGDSLADLAVEPSNELRDYVSFTPIISNYQLAAGGSVEFTAYPDLAKMKSENLSQLSGKLIATCAGKTSEQDCMFDTQGKEITVTTMGQLALKQDGNPFSKLEIIEESVSMQYFNGTSYVELTGEDTDFIQDDGSFLIKSDVDVDLGAKMPLNVTTTMTSRKINDASAIKTGSQVSVVNGDTIRMTFTVAMTEEEYEQFLYSIRGGTQLNARDAALSCAMSDEDNEEAAKRTIQLTQDFNDVTDLFGEGNDLLSDFGFVYDLYTIGSDTIDVVDVYSDPTIPQDVRDSYACCTMANWLLMAGKYMWTAINPLAGLAFDWGTRWLQNDLDSMKELLLKKYGPGSEYYTKLLGRQCTNRGRVSARFYAPSYSSSQKPTMHTSGRMHGDGYVNREDTNYDISLNGEPVGETHNFGLTDVHMEEIPTDNLKPGQENEIKFDYDTNPGSHFVTSETEITLLYPNDTEIAYIDQPDDLQDVRTKSDFCVYGENIYAEGDPIVGEPTQVHFNVYNTGSCSGWFTITCTDDNGMAVYQEVNYYLAAFSGETFTVDWTPAKEHTTFTVSLVNTSIDLEERSVDNNTASSVLTARSRQVPRIASVSAETVYENEPFSVIVDFEQCRDLENVSFSYKGNSLPSEASGYGDTRRYRVSFEEGLPVGEHALGISYSNRLTPATLGLHFEEHSITVSERPWILPLISVPSTMTLRHGERLEFNVLNIDNLLRAEISIDSDLPFAVSPVGGQSASRRSYSVDLAGYAAGNHDVSIKAYYLDRGGAELYQEERVTVTLISESESYYTFSLSSAISNADPKFAVYRVNSHSKESVSVERVGGGYRFLKTSAMLGNPSDYNLVVSYNSGVIVKNLASAGTIDTSNCHQVSMLTSSGNQVSSASITKVTNPSGKYFFPNISVSLEAPLTLSPGKYILNLVGSVDDISVSPTVEVDVTAQNQAIDLSRYVAVYYLNTDHAGSDYYNVSLRTRNTGDSYWNSYSLREFYGSNGDKKYYTTSEYALSSTAISDQVYLLAYSNREVYFIKIRDTADETAPMLAALESKTNSIRLDRTVLNKVDLVTQSGDFSVREVNLRWNNLSVYMDNVLDNTLYVPDGAYTIEAEFSDGSQTFSGTTTATVSSDCQVVLDKDLNADYTDITISWAAPYDVSASVSCSNTAKGWNSTVENITSGSSVKVLNGHCTFNIELTCSNQSLSFTRRLTVGGDGGVQEISIGNQLTGTFSSHFASDYEAEDTVRLSISNVRDLNGNNLTTRSFDPPPKGVATFTDVEDETQKFSSPIAASSLSDISVVLPDEAGEYAFSVVLTILPEPVTATAVVGKTVMLDDPSKMLAQGATVFAAQYEGNKMVDVMSSHLAAGSLTVTFSKELDANWVLFFVTSNYSPLCGKVSLTGVEFRPDPLQ